MSSLHPARRSAERFDSLLHGEQGVAGVSRDAELLELVGALQTLPRIQARPEFVVSLRDRLMVAAETDLVPAGPADGLADRLTLRTRRTPRERRMAIALGGFAIVGATTSMAVAAQSALPGEVLYPVKRVIENAETGFSVSDEAKGNTILGNASGRLDEVDELTRKDDVDADTVAQTLATFSDQATEASRLLMADYTATGSEDPINQLRDFTSKSIETLADLEDVIPAAAEGALLDAAQVLFQIDSLAADLCPVCDSPGITDIPATLLASGDSKLDDAQIAVTSAGHQTLADPDKGQEPDKGKGNDPTVTATDVPTDPIDLPTEGATEDPEVDGSPSTQGPSTPVPTVKVPTKLPTKLPSVGVPAVDDLVDGVVDGVGQVLGGLNGASNKP